MVTPVDRRQFLGAATGLLLTGVANARSLPKPSIRSIGAWASVADATVLADAGYDFIEEEVARFLLPEASEEIFADQLAAARALPIPVRTLVRFLPASMQSVGPDAAHDNIVAFSETVFPRARRAGVETLVFGSPRSRRIPENFSRAAAEKQLIDLCRRLAPIAKANKLILALEPLNHTETNFINRVSEGALIVRKVNHPNIRLVADLFHMRMEDEGPESILQNASLISHVQIAEKQGRRAPGVSGEDFSDCFAALRSTGYAHRLSVECLWSDISLEAPLAMRTLRSLL